MACDTVLLKPHVMQVKLLDFLQQKKKSSHGSGSIKLTKQHYRPFSLDFYRTNYGCNFPLRKLCNDFNFYYDFIDFNCRVCDIKPSLYAGIHL